MSTNTTLEVWLRGPLPNILPLLQPIAHALMQAREEVRANLQAFPEVLLWEQLVNPKTNQSVASVGFHLQHLTGVLDRLFTYARGEALTSLQLMALSAEGNPPAPQPSVEELLRRFDEQIEQALKQLQQTDEQMLTEARTVGRAQLPSTVIGLLTHSAEHTMRHVGQLLVTARLM
ncbi:hypothetical protein GCM10028807_13650 [Spirosoma daeguense]